MSNIVHSEDGKAFERKEVVRLITQALSELGYTKSAQQLQQESSIPVETEAMARLRQHIHQGLWLKAVTDTDTIQFLAEDKRMQCVYILLREEFFDLVEQDKKLEALKLLRGDMTKHAQDMEDVKRLSAVLVRHTSHVVNGQSNGVIPLNEDNIKRRSKHAVMLELEGLIAPSDLVPTGRLLSLLSRAVDLQRQLSLRDGSEPCSLLSDSKPEADLPQSVHYTLDSFRDEIWVTSFSQNGRYLAAGGRSGIVKIFKATQDFAEVCSLEQSDAISSLAWTHDNEQIAVSTMTEGTITVWRAATGTSVRQITHHAVGPCNVACGSKGALATSSPDEGKVAYFRSMADDTPAHEWTAIRGIQLAFTKDEKTLVVAAYSKQVHLFNLETFAETTVPMKASITSLSLSEDSSYFLVNLNSAVIQLYSIESRRLVREYTGHTQTRFIIRSGFGVHDKFVVSGSEDGAVCIWHKDSGRLLSRLKGHEGSVNDVAWHPTNPYMLATVSDDHRIYVWGPDNMDTATLQSHTQQFNDEETNGTLAHRQEAASDGRSMLASFELIRRLAEHFQQLPGDNNDEEEEDDEEYDEDDDDEYVVEHDDDSELLAEHEEEHLDFTEGEDDSDDEDTHNSGTGIGSSRNLPF
eukprot:m.170833 g.170833  ORF g.170833 m.170833 type:complete len:635 (-) comp16490_c2_seq1:462-2366(-)